MVGVAICKLARPLHGSLRENFFGYCVFPVTNLHGAVNRLRDIAADRAEVIRSFDSGDTATEKIAAPRLSRRPRHGVENHLSGAWVLSI